MIPVFKRKGKPSRYCYFGYVQASSWQSLATIPRRPSAWSEAVFARANSLSPLAEENANQYQPINHRVR